MSQVPAILKLLYDTDIIEERAVLDWAAKPSRKYAPKEVVTEVRRRAQPFIEWLAEAEEDSDDAHDAAADDLDVEYDDRAPLRPAATVAAAAPAAPPASAADDGEDDVDIDAI